MNWGRIKTILIILFLMTDIFLASSIFTAKKKETDIPPEVIDAAVGILNEHNISIDRSIIPAKITAAAVLQGDNVIYDYQKFAELLLGSGFSSDNDNTFHTKDAKLTLSGDNFHYEVLAPPAASESFTLNEAQKYAFSYLKELGFDVSSAKAVSDSQNNGICSMKICDFAGNLPIYSSQTDISFSKKGVISLSGSWFNKRDNGAQNNNLKSTAGILVDFAAEYGEAGAEIKSIETGYSILDSATYHKSASLIPVTKIKLDNGSEYLIDSRSAE